MTISIEGCVDKPVASECPVLRGASAHHPCLFPPPCCSDSQRLLKALTAGIPLAVSHSLPVSHPTSQTTVLVQDVGMEVGNLFRLVEQPFRTRELGREALTELEKGLAR